MTKDLLLISVSLFLLSSLCTRISVNGALNPLSLLNEEQLRGLGNTVGDLQTIRHTGAFLSRDVNTLRYFAFPYQTMPNITSEIIFGDKFSLMRSGIIPFRPIKIIVHGFLGNLTHFSTCVPLKDAYMNNGFDNIICLDWGKLATPEIISNESLVAYSFYVGAVRNIASVGKRLAEFIAFLIDSNFASGPRDFHLIGHSLGSHVAGTAGYYVHKMFKTKIGRITGLDPAGPLFGMIPNAEKLDASDANFVDVIHSNSDFFGTTRNSGTVDFFAFGGRGIDQPSCRSQAQVFLGFTALYCGHSLAVDYFKRSIEGEKLVGCRCVKDKNALKPACRKPRINWACVNPTLFGEFVNTKAIGQFHLSIPLKQKNPYRQPGQSHIRNYFRGF